MSTESLILTTTILTMGGIFVFLGYVGWKLWKLSGQQRPRH